MALFLFVLLMAVVLGFMGAVAHGLFYLLIIGIVLVVADVAYASVRLSRRSQRRVVR